MNVRDILNNETFQSKVKSGEISPVFIKEMKQGCFEAELIERLVFSDASELDEFDKEILSGEVLFEPEPVKIKAKEFEKRLTELLSVLGTEAKTAATLSKELTALYKKAGKLIDTEFEANTVTLSVRNLCIFDNADDPTADITEINGESLGWKKNDHLLFAWSENDGAFYLKTAGTDCGSIWWQDHESDNVIGYVSASCSDFLKLILG